MATAERGAWRRTWNSRMPACPGARSVLPWLTPSYAVSSWMPCHIAWGWKPAAKEGGFCLSWRPQAARRNAQEGDFQDDGPDFHRADIWSSCTWLVWWNGVVRSDTRPWSSQCAHRGLCIVRARYFQFGWRWCSKMDHRGIGLVNVTYNTMLCEFRRVDYFEGI